MSHWMGLGQQAAAVLDQELTQRHIAESARTSFIRALRRRPNRLRSVLLAASALGAVGMVIAFAFVRNHPITVTVGGSVPAIGLGASVAAPADREVPLSFSDGSEIGLAPGGEASIANLDRNGGTLGIRHGLAHVHIIHNANTHWAIKAGPYTVAVTGTRFDIDWQPAASRLFVNLFEGSVVVSGQSRPGLTTLGEGQQLLIANGTWTVRTAGEAQPSVVSEIQQTSSIKAGEVALKLDAVRPLGTTSGAQQVPSSQSKSWASFAVRGDYRGAFEAAEREGFEGVCRRSTSAELLSLAEAARFTGHTERAQLALQTLRNRFGGSHDAALAAFQLGRILGGGQASAQWFRTYLREQKGGELAREASGRLLEALSQAGDREGARAEALEYLRLYPQGPHAAFAKRLLSTQSR